MSYLYLNLWEAIHWVKKQISDSEQELPMDRLTYLWTNIILFKGGEQVVKVEGLRPLIISTVITIMLWA